ncbi:uncharacterized protein LOC143010297 isoform X2 [Genypterus blacodes]|uniref:uncharacterized protein LOC143010297 isoform X2 n=1 Tax=Genypterus blacodes TaxID=154954 RepID=UPI003F77758D
MNIFRREKDTGTTPVVPTPAVPPRPSREELDKPITNSLNRPDAASVPQRTGVMGVMQKANPFKSTSQAPPTVNKALSSESLDQGPVAAAPSKLGVMQKINPFKSTPQSSTVSKAPSSESLDQGSAADASQKMGVMQRINPFKSTSQSSTVSKAPSSESLDQGSAADASQRSGMMGVMQKVNPFKSTSHVSKAPSSESLEQGPVSDSAQNPGVFKGAMQKVNPFKSSTQVSKIEPQTDSADSQGGGKQQEAGQNVGMISGMIQKVNPFKSSQPQGAQPLHGDLSSSSGSLTTSNNVPEKQNPGKFKGAMQKINPFKSFTQVPNEDVFSADASANAEDTRSMQSERSSSSGSLDDSTIERHTIWYTDAESSHKVKDQPKLPQRKMGTFRIRRILPSALFGPGSKDSSAGSSDSQPVPEEEVVEVQVLTMAEVPVPSEGTEDDPLDDEDGLLSWWRTVDGWDEWSEMNQDEDAQEVVEDAADRVFMAARLFVRLFNKRGASLQQRILELIALADAADAFHKKTVTASVGGGVASVAGSITTITGLVLAPFTMGASLIVTAVGIGVATAGGLASASANITDTVHSKTDRKKVEQMIQGYQGEIKDIKECLEFVQEGMETLEEWNFDAYAESISKKHLNQNVKHVMKEGGRAGKALVINTESLINTVQVLSVAGGAAKAAQVVSITTGVMSGLFLALDVFFLAKDSIELRKGAKTDFAAKIRDVCKDLQDGLLELNRIKEQLQKTMEGIEVEVEEEEEDEELLKSDLKKLALLEE